MGQFLAGVTRESLTVQPFPLIFREGIPLDVTITPRSSIAPPVTGGAIIEDWRVMNHDSGELVDRGNGRWLPGMEDGEAMSIALPVPGSYVVVLRLVTADGALLKEVRRDLAGDTSIPQDFAAVKGQPDYIDSFARWGYNIDAGERAANGNKYASRLLEVHYADGVFFTIDYADIADSGGEANLFHRELDQRIYPAQLNPTSTPRLFKLKRIVQGHLDAEFMELMGIALPATQLILLATPRVGPPGEPSVGGGPRGRRGLGPNPGAHPDVTKGEEGAPTGRMDTQRAPKPPAEGPAPPRLEEEPAGPALGPRNRDEIIEQLAADPDHGGAVTAASRAEAEAVLGWWTGRDPRTGAPVEAQEGAPYRPKHLQRAAGSLP
jgi:hypothetical protein